MNKQDKAREFIDQWIKSVYLKRLLREHCNRMNDELNPPFMYKFHKFPGWLPGYKVAAGNRA